MKKKPKIIELKVTLELPDLDDREDARAYVERVVKGAIVLLEPLSAMGRLDPETVSVICINKGKVA